MTYSEKLLDPRWQRRRLEILSRDDFTCRHCESKTRTLHVHHRYYITGREPWEYPDVALETLCTDCHGMEPRPGERERAWLEKAHIWFERFHPYRADMLYEFDDVMEAVSDAGFLLSDVAGVVDDWVEYKLGIYVREMKKREDDDDAPSPKKYIAVEKKM